MVAADDVDMQTNPVDGKPSWVRTTTIYLTDDSLRRNVAFGLSDEDIDDQSVWRILTAAQLDVYARSLLRGVHKSGNVKSAYLAANARRLA